MTISSDNIENIFRKNNTPEVFARGYMDYLVEITKKLDYQSIERAILEFLKARENEKSIFFIGNGGSAATASHFANDLGVGTRTEGKHFKAISLTDNSAVITAMGNDYGYETIFTRQLKVLARPGDIVVAISASGNSANVIDGVRFAKDLGCTIIGLTGFDGGKLKILSDISLHVPSEKGEFGPVEDFHMIFDHLIHAYVRFKVGDKSKMFV